MAARTLALAGCVMADEACDPVKLKLGQSLLRESFIAAAKAITGNHTLQSPEDAAAALESRVAIVPIEAVPECDAAALGALGTDAEPQAQDLRDAERNVARLVKSAFAQRYVVKKRHRARPWVRITVLALLVATIVSVPFLPRPWGTDYHWRASSAAPAFKDTGILGVLGPSGLLFHTNEENQPWVIIDMEKSRSIDRVVIKNRVDCCRERGLPLVVEVGLDGTSFTQVGRRTEVFDTWTLRFTAREARYVRIRSEATTCLHFREIRIP